MPGFDFHFFCPRCQKASEDYPLYVFPDTFQADLLLPAWSRRFRCYASLRCSLASEDRALIEKDRGRLRELVAELSSPGLTVGFPLWGFQDDGLWVRVEPRPECPYCGDPVDVRLGSPPRQPAAISPMNDDPWAVPLPALGLSVRARSCLVNAGIVSLGQLCERTKEDLLAIRMFGESSLEEVRERLAACGCKLRGE